MNLSKATNKFMLVFLIYEVYFPMMFAIIFSAAGFNLAGMNIFILNVILTLNTFTIPTIFFCFITRKSFRDIIPLKKIDLIDILLVTIMSVMLIIYSAMFGALGDLFTSNNVGESISEGIEEYSFWVMAFSVGIVPPILEELVFRGVILSGYKKAGAAKAIFLSGLFFGMMHLNFYQLFYTFPLGAALAVFVYYSGNIFSSIWAHFIINFSQIVLEYYIKMLNVPEDVENILSYSHTTAEKFSIFLATIPVCVIITPFFIIALKAFIKRHKNNAAGSKNEYIYESSNVLYEKERIFDLFFVMIFLFYIIYIILSEISLV